MRRAALALTAALALFGGLAGCGDDEGGEDTADGTTTTTSAPATSAEEGSTTTAGDTTTTATDGPGAEDLPGEPFDLYPYEGAALAVVGVAAEDTLNVRSGPGTDFDVVTEAAPTAEGLVATGRNRELDDDSVWAEVEVEGATGWVNIAFVSEPGAPRDVTLDVPTTVVDTVAEVGEIVSASRVFEGEGPEPTITVVARPSDTELVIDVLGRGDDAQEGERLHIVAEPWGEGFHVLSTEATALCSRGVSDGACV